MASMAVAFSCALLTLLALVSVTSARPEGSAGLSAAVGDGVPQQGQPTPGQAVTLPVYRAAVSKSPNKEHGHGGGGGKLSVVHLIAIIGKVIAPLVGAIVEPLLINVVKGITWAITYSLASGFDKPLSYERFVPALVHHGGDGGNYGDDDYYNDNDNDDDDGPGGGAGGQEYESHKPVAYSLKQLPELALQLTSTVLSESSRPDREQAVENAETNLAGLLSQQGKSRR